MVKSSKRVFLSYARDDAVWARKFRDQLSHLGFEVYPGANWPEDVAKAIERADFVVPLMSRRSAKSLWVRREIERAIIDPRLKNRLLTVFLDASADSPWILRDLPSLDEPDPERAAAKVARRLKKTA
jgi:hypothetical protein